VREEPEFIADEDGNVRDVRHLKRRPKSSSSKQPEPSKRDLRFDAFNQIIDGPVTALFGLSLFIGGVALYYGNTTGEFPTFPYAGFITMSIGFYLIATAVKAS
jgi:hypothetical protein